MTTTTVAMRRASLLLLLLSSSMSVILQLAAAGANGEDAAALLAFKAAAVGGNGVLASWNASAGPCSWEGVRCSRHKLVVALSLPSHGLSGTLSPAVGNLSSLRTLDLSFNELHGDIPASLGRLRRLGTLDLSVNTFSGGLPGNLTSCTSLQYLLLGGNNLTGRIPAELGDTLTRLQRLRLHDNSFTGFVPASLGNLTSLQSLNLRMNMLEGTLPQEFGSNMPRLLSLNIFANNLYGALPSSLYNLSSLKKFGVGLNKLHGSIPADIGEKFPQLEIFLLFDNQFSGEIPSSLSNLTNLSYLELSKNGFSGLVPRDLGRLNVLQDLELRNNMLEAGNTEGWEFINSLTNCSQLQVLDLGGNNFTGQFPISIVNLSRTLQNLYLDDIRISGSIHSDIDNLVGLEVLYLRNNYISGVIPESIGKMINLTELYLYNNSLSGHIPSSVGNLTELTKLFAQSNNFEGPIPLNLGELKSLNVLDLSRNHLNGSIPKEILELPSLTQYLNLAHNSLSGPLPSEVGSLADINELSLSGNQLSGQIPRSIKNCEVLEVLLLDNNLFDGSIPHFLGDIKGLRVLNLTMNKFSDVIPDALGSIHNLQELYLAYNNLSGPIPAFLQNLTSLSKLDLSFNALEGEVPKEGIFTNLSYLSLAGNNELCGGIPQLQLPPCPILVVRKKNKQRLKYLTIALPTTGAILVLVSAIVIVLFHHRKLKRLQNSQATSADIKEKYQRVSYYALSRGSNEFSEANLLGKGRYGSVYRCSLEDESAVVAVKVFDLQKSGSTKSFEAECEALRRVRHRCLIKIVTCCSSIDPQGQEFKALVFEFMPNGSLDGWIHPELSNISPSNTLSFSQRLNIAVDIFDALDYLHNQCQPPIIHCDLKPSNILLAEDKSAKVGDFGISRILPKSTTKTLQNSKSSIGIRGSIGYIAPEYGEGSAVTRVGDTYSLGILLLEMFTGRSPTDDIFRDSMDLHKFVVASFLDRALDIADQKIWLHEEVNETYVANASIKGRIIQQSLVSVLRLGISCSKQQPRERMLLADAVSEIHAIRDKYIRSCNEDYITSS